MPRSRSCWPRILRGIDSHGIAMLSLYDELRRTGRLTLAPAVKIVRESPVTALINGGGGLATFLP